MISVFLCGCAGFLVFDVFRIYVVFRDLKVKEFFFGGPIGLVVRGLAYAGAGLLGVFASLDVLISFNFSGYFDWNPELVGSYLRAWGVGIAGPAGISKWDAKAGLAETTTTKGKVPRSLDSLDSRLAHGNASGEAGFAFSRLFLR